MRRGLTAHGFGLGLSLWLLLLAGCGKATPTADIQWAESTIAAALAKWKQGGRPEALTKQATPVQFQDQDWQQSLKLLDYSVKEVSTQEDGLLRCQVRLSLQDRQGKTVEKDIVYIADRARGVIGRDPYY